VEEDRGDSCERTKEEVIFDRASSELIIDEWKREDALLFSQILNSLE